MLCDIFTYVFVTFVTSERNMPCTSSQEMEWPVSSVLHMTYHPHPHPTPSYCRSGIRNGILSTCFTFRFIKLMLMAAAKPVNSCY